MGRALKRQVQQEIRWPNKAGDLRGRKREAKPRGKKRVGRPKKAGAGMPHAKRPALKAHEPIHITIRVDEVVGRLRDAFDDALLDWKVDVIDLNAVSPEFRRIVDAHKVPLP